MYSENLRASRNCLDCFRLAESELCYDCIECTRCYRVQSSERCIDCADSYYLLNCRSCRNCFGCVNLRRAEFCIYNQKVSPSEYQSFITRLALDSFSVREKLRQDFANFALQHPRPHITCSRTEDIRGDFIFDARNVLDSHFIRSSENMRYCFNLERENKDCYDVSYFGAFAELIYESTVCGRNSQSLRFCHDCWDGCSELTYCDYCPGSSNCFGCVGLKKQSYCILNRQFTQTEYEKLLTKIVAHMQKTEEWGEFFPANFTPFPYNISVAQRYFPLTEQEALTQSFRWAEKELPQANQTLEAHLLPDRLPASNSAIVVKSALSSKAFKITSEEIRRYRTFNVPLPRLAYDERMELRAQVLGGLNLFHRKCDKSGKEIVCGYPPESPYIIWDKDEFDREFQ